MTISIGTYDDLKGWNEPQPIDRNPCIACHNCGDSYNYQDYWEDRYVKGKSWNPAKVVWWCDACLEDAKNQYEQHKRKRDHKTLDQYKNAS